jgi:hypothetical protein
MPGLTVRGVPEPTLDVLRREADERGRSLNRHIAHVLGEQASRWRHQREMQQAAQRLIALRAGRRDPDGRPALDSTDSGALLWAERGGR